MNSARSKVFSAELKYPILNRGARVTTTVSALTSKVDNPHKKAKTSGFHFHALEIFP
jgi:hypothetical protein